MEARGHHAGGNDAVLAEGADQSVEIFGAEFCVGGKAGGKGGGEGGADVVGGWGAGVERWPGGGRGARLGGHGCGVGLLDLGRREGDLAEALEEGAEVLSGGE